MGLIIEVSDTVSGVLMSVLRSFNSYTKLPYSWLFSRINLDLEPRTFSASKIGLLLVERPLYSRGVVVLNPLK